MKIAPVFAVPALAIDGLLLDNRPMPARCKLERRIVYNLMLHLYANGFRLHSVFDGEETTGFAADVPQGVACIQAMELAFNLDEASVRFIALDPVYSDAWHGVLCIGGNGVDCIADWNYFEDDRDGFNKIMDEFDAEDFE